MGMLSMMHVNQYLLDYKLLADPGQTLPCLYAPLYIKNGCLYVYVIKNQARAGEKLKMSYTELMKSK